MDIIVLMGFQGLNIFDDLMIFWVFKYSYILIFFDYSCFFLNIFHGMYLLYFHGASDGYDILEVHDGFPAFRLCMYI